MKNVAKNEDRAKYLVNPSTDAGDDAIIAKAIEILTRRMRVPGQALSSPDAVKQYLSLALGDKPHEVFGVLFLDVQNCLIAFEEMFQGTLTQTSVYPREVVLSALKHQACSVVLAHNHPSGNVQPSRADELLTQTLKQTLALVDVRVLDHIIVSGSQSLSMAERGLL